MTGTSGSPGPPAAEGQARLDRAREEEKALLQEFTGRLRSIPEIIPAVCDHLAMPRGTDSKLISALVWASHPTTAWQTQRLNMQQTVQPFQKIGSRRSFAIHLLGTGIAVKLDYATFR